jgi:catechol 2,3-dioxygenase-like lactoylglutathione lyase family enzyme
LTYDSRENAALAVEMFVPDVGSAVAWYADVLGFELLRIEGPAGRAVFAIGVLEGATLMLMQRTSYRAEKRTDWRGAGLVSES